METLNAFKGNIHTWFSWTLLLPLNSLGIEEKYPIREIFMEVIPCTYVLEEHGAFIIQFHFNYVPANCSALPTHPKFVNASSYLLSQIRIIQ